MEWVAIPTPGNLPDPGVRLRSPALPEDSLPSEPPGKDLMLYWFLPHNNTNQPLLYIHKHCLNLSMIDQTDDSKRNDFLSFLRSVEPSHESILKTSLSTSWQMGCYEFQLAEPLMLKGASSPSLTGCGNVPLTTN